MCGLVGVIYRDGQRPVDGRLLKAMADTLVHRGPDADGVWTAAGVGLAHRRLSIIDLAGGDQPLTNEEGSLQVVFNGEIYNFLNLRGELISKGHHFATRSDTEVLVHLYEELGDRLVERLRGMFAFALWDGRKRRLLLARDRVGLKPLYYYRDEEKLLFASEIKGILAFPGVPREIDLEALEDYLSYGVIPGDRSIFEGIRKLPPAHVLAVDERNWSAAPRRYWRLDAEPDEGRSVDEWSEALRAKLAETVKAHLIADVPVGAFLSGGLDSSAVVALAAPFVGEPIQTFSVGFEEDQFSELPYARRVAKRFGTRHVEEIVTPRAVESLDALVHHFDEPFADSSAVATLCLAQVAARQVKVVLSGDGGDEAFGGYTRYGQDLREAAWRRRFPAWMRRTLLRGAARCWPKADWLPRALRVKTALTNLSLDPAEAYANTIAICRGSMRRALLNADVRRALDGHCPEAAVTSAFRTSPDDPLRGMICADVAMLLPDDFLTKVDRASMAVGLEVRPPLVDHEFLELAAKVPSRLKVHNGETKWIFKQMCKSLLPDEIVFRRKQGFEIPVDQWLRGPLREQFVSSVLEKHGRLASHIDTQFADRLYRAHLRRTGRHGAVLWSLLVLGRWMDKYLGSSALHCTA